MTRSINARSQKAARVTRTWAVLPLVVGVSFSLPGCVSTSPPLQAEVRTFPSEQIEIFWTKVYPVNGGIRVSGTVRRAGMSRAALWGHLHVSADLSGSDRTVSADTRWNGNLSARARRSARFSVFIRDVAAEKLESVTVEYRHAADPASAPDLPPTTSPIVEDQPFG